MKKWFLLLVSLFLVFTFSSPAAAFIEAPPVGATGWQLLEWTPDSSFDGQVGWVVSDWGDMVVPSFLLLDNLSHGPTGNQGFELEDLTGYGSAGSVYVDTSFLELGLGVDPYAGSYMAILDSVEGDSGISTTVYGYDGTDGSELYFDLSLDADETFSFWWNFATTEEGGYLDFSLFFTVEDESVLSTWELGQAAPVAIPIPGAVWLLGSGLVGIVGFRRKVKK